MLISLILNLIVLLVSFLTSFLPKVTSLPLGLDATLTTIYGFYKGATSMFAFLNTAMTYFLIGIGMESAYKTYQVLVRFINWIRGSG